MAMSPWARFQSCNLDWVCLAGGQKVLEQIPGAQSRKSLILGSIYNSGDIGCCQQNINQIKAVNTCHNKSLVSSA